MPSKPIRGAMIALPRRSTEAPDDRVTPFGKFTGWLYREGYRQWAKENPNHYPDLAAFAAWAKATGEKTATTANKRALGWPLAQRRGDQCHGGRAAPGRRNHGPDIRTMNRLQAKPLKLAMFPGERDVEGGVEKDGQQPHHEGRGARGHGRDLLREEQLKEPGVRVCSTTAGL